jgi:hypothetical protein
MQNASNEMSRDPTPVLDETVCKKGRGEMTCSFLGVSSTTYVCLKGSSMESNIRTRIQEGTMRAKGDNCSGPPKFTATTNNSKENDSPDGGSR